MLVVVVDLFSCVFGFAVNSQHCAIMATSITRDSLFCSVNLSLDLVLVTKVLVSVLTVHQQL